MQAQQSARELIAQHITYVSIRKLAPTLREQVTVVESHYTPGGAAHSYQHKGYHFESGRIQGTVLARSLCTEYLKADNVKSICETLKV